MNHKIVGHKDDGTFLRYFTNAGTYSAEERSLLSLMRREPRRRHWGSCLGRGCRTASSLKGWKYHYVDPSSPERADGKGHRGENAQRRPQLCIYNQRGIPAACHKDDGQALISFSSYLEYLIKLVQAMRFLSGLPEAPMTDFLAAGRGRLRYYLQNNFLRPLALGALGGPDRVAC